MIKRSALKGIFPHDLDLLQIRKAKLYLVHVCPKWLTKPTSSGLPYTAHVRTHRSGKRRQKPLANISVIRCAQSSSSFGCARVIGKWRYLHPQNTLIGIEIHG